MSDFAAFETAEQPGEADPAADFLAREQDQLAELEGENFEFVQGGDSAPAEPQAEDAGFGDFTGEAAPAEEAQDLRDLVSEALENEPEGQDLFGGGGGGFMVDTQPPPETNGMSADYAAVSQVDQIRAEPEKIKKWREEHEANIRQKDEEERTRGQEMREVATKEMEEWYAKRDEQLNKTKHNNQEAESAFVKERDEVVGGEEWQKIGRMCEFNPKNSKNSKDVSRMRSLLLQLKQNAPARKVEA